MGTITTIDSFQIPENYQYDPTYINFQPGSVELKENYDDIIFLTRFDEPSGTTLIDHSDFAANGLFNVTPTRVPGKLNSAVQFPATPVLYSNHGDLQNHIFNVDSFFSYEGWINPTKVGGNSTIYSKMKPATSSELGFRLMYDFTGRLQFQWFNHQQD